MKIILITILLFATSCSVYKAAQNEGINVSDIRHCNHRACLLSHGMECLSKKAENGRIVEEYRAKARKSGLNYVRAAGHGVLDVATLGLWEVAGTPIKGAISNNRGYIVAIVTYKDRDSSKFASIEIYDANGKKVK